MKPSQEAILDTVLGAVTDMTKDWGVNADPVAATRLNADLGFSSIDMIDLLATLEVKFQHKLPYESFLMVDGGYRSDIVISELAAFIYEKYDTPRPDPTAV